MSEAQKRASARYHSKCVKRLIRFNPDKEQDLIEFIEKVPNFTRYIKELLRQQIK